MPRRSSKTKCECKTKTSLTKDEQIKVATIYEKEKMWIDAKVWKMLTDTNIQQAMGRARIEEEEDDDEEINQKIKKQKRETCCTTQ